jgi:2-amino-4-hydroxy-6-hydroxymethyldihydropteridine diphosphokinase
VVGLREAGLGLVALSSVWESEPVDTTAPPWFLNMVAAIDSDRPPLALLEILLAVERRAGRTRSARNAPRTLDLDLLMVGALHCREPRLELPHPRMWERRFVLEPLAEIAPGARHPASGRTIGEACARLGPRPEVRRVGPLPGPGIIPPSLSSGRSAATDEIQIDRR